MDAAVLYQQTIQSLSIKLYLLQYFYLIASSVERMMFGVENEES